MTQPSTDAPSTSSSDLMRARRAAGGARSPEFVSTTWRDQALRGGGFALLLYAGALWYGWETFARFSARELLMVANAAASFAGILLALVMLLLVVPRIGGPTSKLADVAEAVAGGDLSIRISGRARTGEIGRLWRAVGAMVTELRRLATALRASAAETASLAREITAGSEHMAAAAQQMATTSSELSTQSTDMAETITKLAGDAATLVAIASELSSGAQDGLARNTQLRALAQENRVRLDASAQTLQTLADDVRSSATSVDALAQASEEVRAFVTLVQKMARQSKLLALNAAMEAARAGEHGQGFAVVANEVRRLAANSADAAEKTESLVHGIMERVDESRRSSARAVSTVTEVLEATLHGQQSFGEVERAVEDSEQWTTAIATAAESSSTLVAEMLSRLDELARGTEAFAAAMQEVAASSQEQSASTEEIAAASTALGHAAGQVAGLVATFRLGDEENVPPVVPPSRPDTSADERSAPVMLTPVPA
jgi:methyl-accepting chemotaxis protein